MVNELITNIMKHAFKGIAHPRIRVEARAWGDTARISISDNGVGLPPLAETEGRATFGLTLVRELTKQIGGKLEISRHQGTEFDIEFRKQ